jgi:hypothetical protein
MALVASGVLAITDEATERGLTLLQRTSPEVARNGHCGAAAACPLSEVKRKTCARLEYFAF